MIGDDHVKKLTHYQFIALLAAIVFLLVACGGADDSAAPPADQPLEQPAVEATNTPIPPPAAQPEESYPADADAPAGGEQAAGPRTFVVIPGQSTASYLVDEEFLEDALGKLGINAGEVDVVGTTDSVNGQIVLDLGNSAAPLGETSFSADLSLLKTDQDRRDRWIQENGPRFSLSPQAAFRATSIEGLPDSYTEGNTVQFQLAGDLTIRDVTQPVVFDVVAAINNGSLVGTAETRLLMSNFGIEPPSFARTLSVADEFGIRVNIVAQEQ